jgi:hypothetical protein
MNDTLPIFAIGTTRSAAWCTRSAATKRSAFDARPELSDKPGAAAQWLRDCLNQDRAERLNPDQVFMLLRLARSASYHAAKHWMDAELGYEQGRPLKPEDEAASLQQRGADLVREARCSTQRAPQSTRSTNTRRSPSPCGITTSTATRRRAFKPASSCSTALSASSLPALSCSRCRCLRASSRGGSTGWHRARRADRAAGAARRGAVERRVEAPPRSGPRRCVRARHETPASRRRARGGVVYSVGSDKNRVCLVRTFRRWARHAQLVHDGRNASGAA